MPLPRLATSGNRIVDAGSGVPVRLRGINRSGLEYTEPDEDGFASAAGISRFEIRYLIQQWGATVLRIPFNQDWALRGRGGHTAEDYLRDLDRVILWTSQLGAYTILDLQWLNADLPFGGDRNFVAPLPNPETIDLWRMLAGRYRGETAVLFDLFNEPHNPLKDDPYPMFRPDGSVYPSSYRRVKVADWNPWATKLVETIRAVDPDRLVVVGGTDWAYDLRDVRVDAPNIVYSTHVYAEKGDNWSEAFGDTAQLLPVIAGEFGGTDTAWGRRLLNYFDQLGIGWLAWSWVDKPYLMSRYAATPFGAMVRDKLTEAASD